jgi:hypothetical protein
MVARRQRAGSGFRATAREGPRRKNFFETRGVSIFFLSLLFKLVVVDKGRAVLWTGHYFTGVTRTCVVPPHVRSRVFCCRGKRDNFRLRLRPVDNPWLVPELSPELSFDRGSKIWERSHAGQRHPLLKL